MTGWQENAQRQFSADCDAPGSALLARTPLRSRIRGRLLAPTATHGNSFVRRLRVLLRESQVFASCFVVLAISTVYFCDVQLTDFGLILFFSVGVFALLGQTLLGESKFLGATSADRLLLGWSVGLSLPFAVALVGYYLGSVLAGVAGVCVLVAAIAYSRRLLTRSEFLSSSPRTPAPQDAMSGRSRPAISCSVPPAIYITSLLYTLLCVVVPFGWFSSESLVREMYGDGFQRFAVLHAIADAVPPSNPFVAGAPLSYYWFSLVPLALTKQIAAIDTFAIWKTYQTVFCFFAIPAIWLWLRIVFRSAQVATTTVVLAFIAASFELFYRLPQQLSTWSQFGYSRLLNTDPDQRIGLLTPFSDQLLFEDYLYIPQNAQALLLVVLMLAAVHFNRWISACALSAALFGINSFLFVPAFAGLCAVLTTTALGNKMSWRSAGQYVCLGVAATLVSASLCGVSTLSPTLLAVICCALLAVCLGNKRPNAMLPAAVPPAWPLRFLALGICASLLAAALFSPLSSVLFWNYGLCAPGAICAICCVTFSPARVGTRKEFTFILAYLAAHILCTATLLLLVKLVPMRIDLLTGFPISDHTAPFNQLFDSLVDWSLVDWSVVDWLAQSRARVSPFNFYHKSSKVVRLLLCILTAWGLSEMLAVRSRRPPAWIVYSSVCILLLAGFATTAVRAFSYARTEAVAEAPLGRHLRDAHVDSKTVVVLEDYRNSRLLQLAPVSAYYFSSWGDGGPGLAPLGGNWVDQYLSLSDQAEGRRRETALRQLFAAPLDAQKLELFLQTEAADYLVTAKVHALEPCAHLVASTVGANLYDISSQCKHVRAN